MEILLIRHAHAGERLPGGRDRYRTLSPKGHDQAQAIAQALADRPIDTFMASPATRCVQTLEPSAATKGLELQEREEFWEGSSLDDVMALLNSLVETAYSNATTDDSPPAAVICSHGDIIPEVVERLSRAGVEITCKLDGLVNVECRLGAAVPFDDARRLLDKELRRIL